MSGVRLDRWLWSTRHFKTRTIATDACKRNQVKVNETAAKPSRLIQTGDLLGKAINNNAKTKIKDYSMMKEVLLGMGDNYGKLNSNFI